MAFFCVLIAAGVHGAPASAEDQLARIGVLAYRGTDTALTRWTPTARYLSERIDGYRFQIVPLTLESLSEAIYQQRIQFTLTNPGNYVDLETRFGASRIATLQTREGSRTRVRYGAVIVARSDNPDISRLADLRGKSFMGVSADAFGGFQMAWRELSEQGIDPFRDFSELRFAGFPQDQIILAVRERRIDAATVRAETLARMIESGRIADGELRILNAQPDADSPFALSTRLYPEWPFATLRDTPRELAEMVAQALLSMPQDHPAARASRTAGWTIPLDYSPVHELMHSLQIGPYEVLRQTSLLALLQRYAWWVAAAATLLVALILLNGYVSRTNHRLKETERDLRNEIVQRKRSQEALASYRDTLEEQVAARTQDLKTTNRALEKSRVALRELVRITSAPDLGHEEKLLRLLDTGRDYFAVPVAVLASVEHDEQRVCKVSGDSGLAPSTPGPLHAGCAEQLARRNGEPLDIPDLATARGDSCTDVGNARWRSYLGAAVMVEGGVHCTLEFAGTEPRQAVLSQWDHELLKVMAQWIGDELERQLAMDAQRQHEAEVARVSRVSIIGEMAASLAHELNQPLTGAINYCSGCLRLLREGKADRAKLTEGMQRAVEGATLAADIIRHIREFVSKGEPRRAAVNLNHAVTNVVALLGQEARRRGVVIELDLAPQLPPVEGNLIQLEQVILNLIRNGMDAMDTTEPGRRRLTIRSASRDGAVEITTTDNGEGIAQQEMARIFDAFYSTKPDGMGIGLSISRSIVESHEGRITARALPQGGTMFNVSLPVAG